MEFLGLSFGKKRRKSTKRAKKVSSRKPPSKLLRICKKYRVKATKKVGGKRVYKSVASLKKMCLRKARALKKRLEKAYKKRKGSKSTKRRKGSKRRDAFGEAEMEFGRRRRRMSGFGMYDQIVQPDGFGGMGMEFGRRRLPMFGNVKVKAPPPTAMQRQMELARMGQQVKMFGKQCEARKMTPQLACIQSQLKFGKRRRVGARSGKTSRKAAMTAFRAFYKRHCAGRRSGFGNGGNPPLSASMGYEFCPNGQGGVLGFNSTGLYPSPCTSKSSSFGRRRRRSTAAFGRRRRRRTSCGAFGRRRRSATGTRRRRKFGAAPCAGVRSVKARMKCMRDYSRKVSSIGRRRRS